MCIQWARVLYSVAITRQILFTYHSPCNEFTSFWSMFVYTIQGLNLSTQWSSNIFLFFLRLPEFDRKCDNLHRRVRNKRSNWHHRKLDHCDINCSHLLDCIHRIPLMKCAEGICRGKMNTIQTSNARILDLELLDAEIWEFERLVRNRWCNS